MPPPKGRPTPQVTSNSLPHSKYNSVISLLDPAPCRRLDAAPIGSTLAWEKGVATDFQRGYRGFKILGLHCGFSSLKPSMLVPGVNLW
ncbi:MAG: hypothetical protein ACFFCF_02780, partial [Promethearchaeota archaeon]